MINQGFIDLQVNGYSGIDFSRPGLTKQEVIRASRGLYLQETVAYMPTLVTTSREAYSNNLPVIAAARSELMDMPGHARIIGIHLEGPFISPLDGARGVHPQEYIRLPSIPEFDWLYDLSAGWISLLTLAPELKNADLLTEYAVNSGVKVSLGHTLAGAPEIDNAVDAGARFSTHLGNGIPMWIHRHQNPIWPQLANPRLTALIIPDGHHLPEPFIKTIIACKGPGNVIATSDASPLAGCPPGDYSIFGTQVKLEANGRLSDPKTGYLAGSSATMKDCGEWLASIAISECQIKMVCLENASLAFQVSTMIYPQHD